MQVWATCSWACCALWSTLRLHPRCTISIQWWTAAGSIQYYDLVGLINEANNGKPSYGQAFHLYLVTFQEIFFSKSVKLCTAPGLQRWHSDSPMGFNANSQSIQPYRHHWYHTVYHITWSQWQNRLQHDPLYSLFLLQTSLKVDSLPCQLIHGPEHILGV